MAAPASAFPHTESPVPGVAGLRGGPLRRRAGRLRIDLAGLKRLDDDALAAAVARHGAPAFNILYERLHQAVFGYCCAILRDRTEAEDVFQEAMSRAYRHLASGSAGKVAAKPWLMAIARNACIDRIRRRDQVEDPSQIDEVIATAPSVQTSVEERERLRTLLSDLGELSESQRSALVLREMSGLGHEEIASALGTTAARSKSLISEARQTLADRALGREMPCADLRSAVAERGNRALRGRQVHAHAQSCPRCSEFVEQRKRERALAAFVPLLPATQAQTILGSVLGGSGAASAGIGGGLIASIGGAAGGKGLAVIAAVGALGGGAVVGDLPQRAAGGIGDVVPIGSGDSGAGAKEASSPAGAKEGSAPQQTVGDDQADGLGGWLGGNSGDSTVATERAGTAAGSTESGSSAGGAADQTAGRIEPSPNPGSVTGGGSTPGGTTGDGSTSPGTDFDVPQLSLPSQPDPPSPSTPSQPGTPDPGGTPQTPGVPSAPSPPQPPSVGDTVSSLGFGW